ncbi:Ribosomal protein L25/Gln-tRNA synthetase, anti-codon-binding domain [Pseudocohnilembus persalinus]|uniref:glutamine--tRNA ligase n=1 Tax=Pseudocohnilembus persalinus TaxID=266149 RepID=A0A0V0QNQ3_PSEPJ|nr:Ribosomal protein L25/Gln-tRNA synthetase, anti-codon-binding domain [Pseudocohnilembus persalinus]|eukprot:KRX03600.1 Ribosomal protein L25/Gln-tRNA synthetase, anti-codon-binding domain [Pseudocohnilembus persalinus]
MILDSLNYEQIINSKNKANLVLNLAQNLTDSTKQFHQDILNLILQENKIASNTELQKGLQNLKNQVKISKENINWHQFIEASQQLNDKQIDQIYKFIKSEFLNNYKNESIQEIQQKLDGKQIYDKMQPINKFSFVKLEHIEKILLDLPKIEQQKKRELQSQKSENNSINVKSKQKGNPVEFSINEENKIWDKLKNLKGRDIPLENNSNQIYQQHLERTKGQYILRFPPEPNGFLHLGHVKSIVANFESALRLGGICYLRFDDTNPESESQEYINDIIGSVEWMGYQPFKITYSSDYFDDLYENAIKLIKKGKAYVCELNSEQSSQYRKDKLPSPYRERSIEENLYLFEGMKNGKYKEGQYVLRAKITYDHLNPTLRDPAIYRIKYTEHPRTKDKWCIYPLYDYTHGMCDSLQDITHSLCTLEFEIRRELYYWFLNELDLYKPIVFEFSRLNVSNNVLSKRKINKLIQFNLVENWDDPRLFTIQGLRKRGIPSEALKQFVNQLNVTRTGNENLIRYYHFQDSVRGHLLQHSQKAVAVVDPVKFIIENVEQDFSQDVEIAENQTQKIKKEIYIEQQDVAKQNQLNLDNFYGAKVGHKICLKYFGIIEITDIQYEKNNNNEQNKAVLVKGKLISQEFNERKKIKGQLHWLSSNDSQIVQIRLIDRLFNVENPQGLKLESELKEGYNKDSIQSLNA